MDEGMVFLLFLLALCLWAGVAYYTEEPGDTPRWRRWLVSSYPFAAGIASVAAVIGVFWGREDGEPPNPVGEPVFLFFFLGTPALAVLSLLMFNGSKWTHLWLLPISFVYLFFFYLGLFSLAGARLS